MALLSDQDSALQLDMDIITPAGWTNEEETNPQTQIIDRTRLKFSENINNTLKEATQRTQDLMQALSTEVDIYVSTAYLTINEDASYHIFLMVRLEDYHSPHIQAAQLLAEKYTDSNSDFAIRFTFIVARENIIAHLTSSEIKLKYVNKNKHINPGSN